MPPPNDNTRVPPEVAAALEHFFGPDVEIIPIDCGRPDCPNCGEFGQRLTTQEFRPGSGLLVIKATVIRL